MSSVSANLNLPFLAAAQAQKHVTHNAALELLDALVQLTIVAFDASTPPASPQDGQVWALGPAPVNEWAGMAGRLAIRANGGWAFVMPRQGWLASHGASLHAYDGSAWVPLDMAVLQNLDGLGVGTSYDATNALAVAAPAALFTHAGAGHQVKINKNAPGDTASVVFQTGFSGRAELGTAGSNEFTIKVSPNGTAWTTALSVAAATGLVSGQAVVQSDADVTPGRLLTTLPGPAQAYRQGNLLGVVSHSGGVPTGAVIERGSNASGNYVRFADGTQIATANNLPVGNTLEPDGALWRRLLPFTVNFPIAFVSAPVVSAGPVTSDPDVWITPESATAMSFSYRPRSTLSKSGIASSGSMIAVGRWF